MTTEIIWETFDNLFKTVGRQARRVEELEARVVELEKRLNAASVKQAPQSFDVSELTAERAA